MLRNLLMKWPQQHKPFSPKKVMLSLLQVQHLPPSILGKFYELDEHLYEVQETVDKPEYILVQHNDMLDGITHNQAIIDNRLSNLQNTLSQ